MTVLEVGPRKAGGMEGFGVVGRAGAGARTGLGVGAGEGAEAEGSPGRLPASSANIAAMPSSRSSSMAMDRSIGLGSACY